MERCQGRLEEFVHCKLSSNSSRDGRLGEEANLVIVCVNEISLNLDEATVTWPVVQLR